MFLSAVQDTKWYQTTNQNQRAWQQAETQDPATAANALRNAQEQVLSTANQIGVTLSKATLDKIANMYASNYYTPTGILGTEAGTSQGWLDQAVIDSVTTVQKSGTTPDTVASANAMATPGAAGQTTTTGANGQTVVSNGPTTGLENQGTTGITGLAATLYQDFQQVAQQYLLYNPTNPTGGLLTRKNLMDYVNSTLKTYTGTGSSGLVSQFAQDATDNFTKQMMAKASQLYPSLAAPIAQGTTPQTYTQSEANLISSTLGIDASSIDFTSPQWNWVIADTHSRDESENSADERPDSPEDHVAGVYVPGTERPNDVLRQHEQCHADCEHGYEWSGSDVRCGRPVSGDCYPRQRRIRGRSQHRGTQGRQSRRRHALPTRRCYRAARSSRKSRHPGRQGLLHRERQRVQPRLKPPPRPLRKTRLRLLRRQLGMPLNSRVRHRKSPPS